MRALRIASGALSAISVAALVWIQLRMPGLALGGGTDPVLRDPYYVEAAVRQTTPFVLGAAALGLIVLLAAGTTRARIKRARIGLWLVLAGGVLALGFAGEWILHQSASFGSPRRYQDIIDYKDSPVQAWTMILISIAGVVCLLAGAAAWLSAHRRAKPDDAG